jgi:hypothetical protein
MAMSCGANFALLNYVGKRGSGLDDAKNFVGTHHFGFQVDDIAATQKQIEAAGGKFFFFDLGEDQEKKILSANSKIPTASSSISRAKAGSERTIERISSSKFLRCAVLTHARQLVALIFMTRSQSHRCAGMHAKIRKTSRAH